MSSKTNYSMLSAAATVAHVRAALNTLITNIITPGIEKEKKKKKKGPDCGRVLSGRVRETRNETLICFQPNYCVLITLDQERVRTDNTQIIMPYQ